jgi:hypothetical protein
LEGIGMTIASIQSLSEQWERGDAKDAAALMKPADEETLQC